MDIKLKLDKEAKETLDNFASSQNKTGGKNREEIQKLKDDELKFTICTNSGTYINIPSGYLKFVINTGLFLGTAAVTLKAIDLIMNFKLKNNINNN